MNECKRAQTKTAQHNNASTPRTPRHATHRNDAIPSSMSRRRGVRAARGPSHLMRASSGEPGGRRHGPPPPTATVPPAHHPLTRASQPPTIYVATHAHCPSTHAPEPTNSSATSSTARVPAAPAHAANGNARRPPPAVRRSARTCVAGTRRRNCLPAAARRRPATNTARSTVGWPTSVADARWRRGPAGHRDPWRRAPPAVRRPQQRIPRCAPRTHVRASPARGGGAPTHPLQAWLGPSSDIVVCRAASHRERRLQQQRANERAVRRPQERSHRCAPRTHAPPQLPAATAAAQSPPSAAVTTSTMVESASCINTPPPTAPS